MNQRRSAELFGALLIGYPIVIVALAITLLAFCQCAPNNAILTGDKGAVYRYDMVGAVNGVPFDGVGVIPRAEHYEMEISSLIDIDLLTISSCHRDFHVESAIRTNWLQPRRTFRYVYRPSPGIEDSGSCLVRMGAYTKAGGQAAWAILDFRTPDASLPATNYCNGAQGDTGGVSICQSRVGLIQRLGFAMPVDQSQKADPRCAMRDVKGDGRTWEMTLPAGECVLVFQERQPPYRQHRHTTVSYTDILIRGG